MQPAWALAFTNWLNYIGIAVLGFGDSLGLAHDLNISSAILGARPAQHQAPSQSQSAPSDALSVLKR
eukprot:3693658-Amphidinium_carterae.1